MTIEELLNGINSPSTTKWEVPVVIKRSNPLPLDSTGLFPSLEAAQNYAFTLSGATVEGVDPISYYSQIISVLDSNTNTVSLHVIVPPPAGSESDKTKYLQKIATLGDVYSKTEVDDKLAELPQYMILRGTLGEGGTATISAIPTPVEDTLGDTYKVITTGEYAYTKGEQSKTISAKSGDTITCYKTADGDFDWMLIPSGDEEGTIDTWRSITVNGVDYLGNSISTGNLNIKSIEGNPLQISTDNGLTFSHTAISTVLTGLDNTTPKYIKGITVDGNGHITAVSVGDVKVYNSIEVVSEGESGDVVDTFNAATEADIIRFLKGSGVKLVTFHDNVVPIGTPYYQDETLNTQLGTIDVSGLTSEPVGEDRTVSRVEGYGYIKTIKGGIQINHQGKPTEGQAAVGSDQLITNINLDEYGHISTITNISQNSFLRKFIIGDQELSVTTGSVALNGDDKLSIQIIGGSIKLTHSSLPDRDQESQLTETGELITAVNVDATGHVGAITRRSVTVETIVDSEGLNKDKVQLNIGSNKLVEITELTTDILSNGSTTLILDGNF